MQKLAFILLFIVFNTTSRAQTGIQWQRSYGGSKNDVAVDVKMTADGGYIVLGTAESGDGHLPGNKGGKDIWLLKINRVGLIDWQRILGGTGVDDAIRVEPVGDGFIVLGNTNSSDGDVNRDSSKFKDAWVVKLNQSGEILWSKVYGASKLDEMFDLLIDEQSEVFYLFGKKNVESGLQLPNYWLIKTTMDGALVWEKTYGGSGPDIGRSLTLLPNGRLVLFGVSGSSDGDVDDHVGQDYWIVEIDTMGLIKKKQVFNLNCTVDAEKIIATEDGKMMALAQICETTDCDTLNYGACDYFVFKLNNTNSPSWFNHYGGSISDFPHDIIQNGNSTFLIAGSSNSTDSDLQTGNNYGGFDVWLLQIKEVSPGNFEKDWTLHLGSSASDGTYAILQTAPGEHLVAGFCGAADGNVTHHRGGQDVWIVKLGLGCPPTSVPAQPVLSLGNAPCNTDHLELNTSTYAGDKVTYFWSTPRGVVETTAPHLVLNDIQPGADDGLYALLVEVNGCLSLLSDELDLAVIRDTARIHTENQTVCNNDFSAVQLQADSARTPLTGAWRASAGAGVANAAAPNTTLASLVPGLDTLVWTLSYQHCPDFSSDTLLLYYETDFEARPDSGTIELPDRAIALPVLENDILTFVPQAEIISIGPVQPNIGTLGQTGPGTLEYTGALLPGETDRFEYEVCSATCPEICDLAAVIITGLSDLHIPGGITPGDANGLNDLWVIDELEHARFQDNELIIVNRWGETVFRKSGYRNDWDGGDLPEGVYYYLLNIKSIGKTYEGSIHLFR